MKSVYCRVAPRIVAFCPSIRFTSYECPVSNVLSAMSCPVDILYYMYVSKFNFQVAALGGFILFFGFLAFNGGSQTSVQNEGDGAAISLAVVNTVISASFAAFSALFINKIKIFGNASWSLLITINGALTGMVYSISLKALAVMITVNLLLFRNDLFSVWCRSVFLHVSNIHH